MFVYLHRVVRDTHESESECSLQGTTYYHGMAGVIWGIV